ncbi:MAG: asparagine synthase (glutamine-hydrolyzing), partial [Syntrophales bacterium]|nr:asparagine synthase (glutamine-hydrolyzing) [Syntrophales bacterium]
MCGIAGYKVTRPVDRSVLEAMIKALYNRGPDAGGFYASGDYHAGMRRLMINDLKTGNQPLFNADKSVALLYNGEIYNSPELRRELEAKGYRFRTSSDGEVICHLYDEYGDGLFERLDGMFAAALWVEREKKLILARDIPGEKPLYFSKISDREIVFSSQVRSVKLFPDLDLDLNYQAIWDLPTFLWIPEPQTIYSSVQSLPPGHILIADDSGIRIRRYGNKFNRNAIVCNDDSIISETRRVVEEAVVSRLLSDVPVGAFLSGGLDSSIVVALAARHLDGLTTFTIGFENLADPYHGHTDESSYAEAYARQLGTRHCTIRVAADTFLKSLDDFCRYADQPFSVSSGLGLLAIAKAARDAGIKVLLSGDGADENFGGYSWYSHIPEGIGIAGPDAPGGQSISFQNLGMPLDERMAVLRFYSPQERAWAWHYYASEGEKRQLFSPDIFDGAGSSLRFFHEFNPHSEWQGIDYIRQDRIFYLPNEMLSKVDRMTMAYSVEGRAPFVAPSVLSHAEKLQYHHLIRGGVLKWALRKSFEDILPDEIISRPKHGFNVPIDHWLKDKWSFMIEEAFSRDSALYKQGIIHEGSLAKAREMMLDDVRLNGHTIFTYIMLNH